MVSVIIRTHGIRAVNLLNEAIKSVRNQTYKEVEIIVIEDGTNNAEKHLEKDIIYKSIPQSGRCVAGNIGLELAQGKYIMFLDDDDQLYADHISTLINELDNNNQIDAAYSIATEVPTKFINLNPLLYQEGKPRKSFTGPFSRVLLWTTNYISIQSIIFRRKLYDMYGGFDIQLNCLEDWDLWLRYSFHHDFKFINKVTSFYRVPFEKDERKKRAVKMSQYSPMIYEKLKRLKFETNAFEINKLCKEFQEAKEYRTPPKSFFKELWAATNIGRKLKMFERQIRKKIKG